MKCAFVVHANTDSGIKSYNHQNKNSKKHTVETWRIHGCFNPTLLNTKYNNIALQIPTATGISESIMRASLVSSKTPYLIKCKSSWEQPYAAVIKGSPWWYSFMDTFDDHDFVEDIGRWNWLVQGVTFNFTHFTFSHQILGWNST